MSAHQSYRDAQRAFIAGQSTSAGLLAASSRYLQASADWPEVRDVLHEHLGMELQAQLEWFGQQDFPDFAEAVDEGWGWRE